MGQTEANMGVAVGDVYGNGNLTIFITHQHGEKNTLFASDPEHQFHDASRAAGIAMLDLSYTGWGTGFIDFDNSGNLGLAIVNGRIRALILCLAPIVVHSGMGMPSTIGYSRTMAPAISQMLVLRAAILRSTLK